MDDWLRLPYTLSTWFVAVCYATLLASLVLCPLLLLRRLAGRRLRSLSRMALWYVLLALMLLLPASMHWGTGFTFVGRVGPDYALPPVCFTFRALGRLVSDGGGPFWQPSGALRLHVFASLSPTGAFSSMRWTACRSCWSGWPARPSPCCCRRRAISGCGKSSAGRTAPMKRPRTW